MAALPLAEARREVAAVQFPTRRADGWRPAVLICEELYAQATKHSLPREGNTTLFDH
jgi:hypothetical protein